MPEAGADDDRSAAEVAELFVLPPEEFVAARNALVRGLKASGRKELAATVGALRRPSPADWALNRVAFDEPDAVERFLAAAATARDAQAAAIEGRPGDDLRTAVRTLRETTADVARLADAVLASAGRSSGAVTGAVASRLAAVAASAPLGGVLRQHRLGSETGEPDDAFAALEPAAGDASARGGAARSPTRKKSSAQPAGPDRRDLTRALAVAERAQRSATAALARAVDRLQRAEAAVLEAEEQLAAAQRSRSDAAAEHGRLQQAADAADRDVAAAQANLAKGS